MAFSQNISYQMMIYLTPINSRSTTKWYKHQENKELALDLHLQTYQILTNDKQMLILCLSYIITTVFRYLPLYCTTPLEYISQYTHATPIRLSYYIDTLVST